MSNNIDSVLNLLCGPRILPRIGFILLPVLLWGGVVACSARYHTSCTVYGVLFGLAIPLAYVLERLLSLSLICDASDRITYCRKTSGRAVGMLNVIPFVGLLGSCIFHGQLDHCNWVSGTECTGYLGYFVRVPFLHSIERVPPVITVTADEDADLYLHGPYYPETDQRTTFLIGSKRTITFSPPERFVAEYARAGYSVEWILNRLTADVQQR